MNSPLLCPSRFVLKFLVAAALVALANAEPSTVQIRESSKDRAVTLQTEGDEGLVTYLAPFATGLSTVTATLGLYGIDVASFDENTRFELVVGRHSVFKRLGDDPNYRRGSTAATFTELTSSPVSQEAPAAIDSRRLQLKWSAKSLRATLSLRSNDLDGAPWSMAWAGPMRGEENGKTLSAVIAGHIAIGPVASSAFEVQATGKLGLKRIPQRTSGFDPVTLSTVSFGGSGKGSGRVPTIPSFAEESETEVVSGDLPAAGGSIVVPAGALKGALLTIPPGVFPGGAQLSLREVVFSMNVRGASSEAKGLRVAGTVQAPAGGFLEIKLPKQISANGLNLPHAIDAGGNIKPLEIVDADFDAGTLTVRLPVPASKAVPQPLSAASEGQPLALAASGVARDIEETVIVIKEIYEDDDRSLYDLLEDGFDRKREEYAAWWKSFWDKQSSRDPDPIESELEGASGDYSLDRTYPVPAVRISAWDTKKAALDTMESDMESEESGAKVQVSRTGFSPRVHGFSISSGPSTHLADTSSGMVNFALWAFSKKNGYPLYNSFLEQSTRGNGQNILAARASVTASAKPLLAPRNLRGSVKYHLLLKYLSIAGNPVALQVSKVNANGEFLGLRYLLAYGVAQPIGSALSPRILVYDPSSPGDDRRLVRYHPDYGMFYRFSNGNLGVDVRPILSAAESNVAGSESFDRIMAFAEADRLDGISEIEEFSIEQGDYVANEVENVGFYLHDGGELPVRLLRFNDQEFEIPVDWASERTVPLQFSPGKNIFQVSAFGDFGGVTKALDHPEMTENPREIYWMKMPLTVTKIAGDRQSAPEGSLQLRDNLKVLVKDANGLPVPYPTLKWSIVDPVAYGGGKLSAGSSSGTSWTARYFSPDGEGWASWAVGTTKYMFQEVSVDVVGLSRMDKSTSKFIAAIFAVKTTGAALFSAANGCPDETVAYEEACLGDWVVSYPIENPIYAFNLKLYEGGRGEYVLEDGRVYGMRWWIVRRGCDYYLYDSGFWSSTVFGMQERDPLTLFPGKFYTYVTNRGGIPSREFFKKVK